MIEKNTEINIKNAENKKDLKNYDENNKENKQKTGVKIGRIFGKITTTKFKFIVENSDLKKYDYVQVWHKDYGFVLGQVYELERQDNQLIASCLIFGYNKNNTIQGLLRPFESNQIVLKADNSLITKIFSKEKGAYIGLLKNTNVKIKLDLNKVLTKHLSVLAKTGAGKSYTVGVLIEELIENGYPVVVIDPHGEYHSLRYENTNKHDIERMIRFDVKPKSFKEIIDIYAPVDSEISDSKPLILKDSFDVDEILDLMPNKLTPSQKTTLLSILSYYDKDQISLLELINLLKTQEESKNIQTINNLITNINYLINSKIFSENGFHSNELIKLSRTSIVDLKGLYPEMQQIIVSKILTDLFQERKKNTIPPFFLVIEESHNFIPERSFGEAKTSKILRTIASEGRKFGIGLCIITQRPSRIDKSVLSQCNTNIVLKITNPYDIKSIFNSLEGLNIYNSEDDLRLLNIGEAIITGVHDLPLFVEIRPRKTSHLGNITFEETKSMYYVIKSNIEEKDLNIIYKDKKFSKVYIPAKLFIDKQDNLFLFDCLNMRFITDKFINLDEFMKSKETMKYKYLNKKPKFIKLKDPRILPSNLDDLTLNEIKEKLNNPLIKDALIEHYIGVK